MNEPAVPVDFARLARAVRFALVCFVIGMSYFTVRAGLLIEPFEQIYRDMLNGKPLPALTLFLFSIRYGVIAVTFLIPAVAIAGIFSRHLIQSIYVIGGLLLLNIVLAIFICQALLSPLMTIFATLQGG